MDGYQQNQIATEVQPVVLYPLVDQLTGFGWVSILDMMQHLFNSYGAIDETDLEENGVKMMGLCEPVEPLSHLIEKLEKGREFACAGGQTTYESIMVFKCITLLAQMATFNKDIREYRQQTNDLNTWSTFKTFLTNPIVNKVERSQP